MFARVFYQLKSKLGQVWFRKFLVQQVFDYACHFVIYALPCANVFVAIL